VTTRDRVTKRDFGHASLGKMHYIIYKITNQINGKYYIGRHATKNVNDLYMGSGIGIKNAIAKYDVENFIKEIIAEAASAEELWDLEKDIVNKEVVSDPMSYNNTYGGKHYLHGLKKYDYALFLEHQQKASALGHQKGYMAARNNNFHKLGGVKSSHIRSKQYVYRITTNLNEEFVVNGSEFKKLCDEKNWNYNTLHWKNSMGKYIKRGKHQGFLVEQISTYSKEK
jgi:hypothetical protein